jgi:hypothetical protein
MMFDTFQADFARDRALALIDERGSDLHENVLIHADAGGKLILVLMSQMSLRGYFGGPPSDVESAPAKLTLAEWNQVVDHNIDAFRRIAFSMLRSGRRPPGRCVDAGWPDQCGRPERLCRAFELLEATIRRWNRGIPGRIPAG